MFETELDRLRLTLRILVCNGSSCCQSHHSRLLVRVHCACFALDSFAGPERPERWNVSTAIGVLGHVFVNESKSTWCQTSHLWTLCEIMSLNERGTSCLIRAIACVWGPFANCIRSFDKEKKWIGFVFMVVIDDNYFLYLQGWECLSFEHAIIDEIGIKAFEREKCHTWNVAPPWYHRTRRKRFASAWTHFCHCGQCRGGEMSLRFEPLRSTNRDLFQANEILLMGGTKGNHSCSRVFVCVYNNNNVITSDWR